MQVYYDEGVAIHIGPESCVVAREGRDEALTGERIGQPLSHERNSPRGADAVRRAEGNTDGHAIARAWTSRRGQRPWHVRTLSAREPGDPRTDQEMRVELVRIGKARSRSR